MHFRVTQKYFIEYIFWICKDTKSERRFFFFLSFVAIIGYDAFRGNAIFFLGRKDFMNGAHLSNKDCVRWVPWNNPCEKKQEGLWSHGRDHSHFNKVHPYLYIYICLYISFKKKIDQSWVWFALKGFFFFSSNRSTIPWKILLFPSIILSTPLSRQENQNNTWHYKD